MTNPTPLSGEQIDLHHAGYAASIASVGASLRSLTSDGRDLVVPFEASRIRPVYRGAVLVPWPNRVVDGRYDFDGTAYQLPLTEPERGHALHGLVAWTRFVVSDRASSSVRLTAEIVPSDGYPFPLEVAVTYSLGDDGLTTTVETRNLGGVDAPYGVAPHPYLVAGEGLVDDWTLHLPAASYLDVTPDRLVPVAVRPVSDRPEFDFRTPRPIGATFVDHAFTELEQDAWGRASVVVTAPEGTGVRLTWGSELPWAQVHTADRPVAAEHRVGLAVEPMTCPPDAFSSGTDLVRLAPGAAHSASWSIAAV